MGIGSDILPDPHTFEFSTWLSPRVLCHHPTFDPYINGFSSKWVVYKIYLSISCCCHIIVILLTMTNFVTTPNFLAIYFENSCCFFFFKNFSRVSPNLAYLKLSTKSTSVPNQPFPQFNILIILQHILINNISLSLTYQLNE
jgi:hypothetical protein